MPGLPIEPALPELRRRLCASGAAVLQAPPGAGKSTLVPLALLDEPWLSGRIVMLEPRRLATRAVARRMAELLGEPVGQTVGYRIRRESRVGPRTRIEVVTEGILGRMLEDDPALDGVGLVIFDEFHERSIHADFGLALALQSKRLLRDDLRLLVMSATLEGGPIAALLGGAPVVTSQGRSFPVETRYLPRREEQRFEAAVAAAVRQALEEEAGDILVFLPGAAEIRRVEALVEEFLSTVRPPVLAGVIPLHGSLTQELQDRALRPSTGGGRKIVLATSIAETSLTIEGVRVVIDAGLSRVPRFSPRNGMTRLETIRVSRASADQRRGRAGRLGPGVCYRLWPLAEDAHLVPRGAPEILEADLAPLALQLANAGISDPAELAWLDSPPAAALAEARRLLRELGALDAADRITAHGRALAAVPVHPRLAHMLVRGRELGLGPVACDLAALLEERDVLRGLEGPPDADLRLRLDVLHDRAVSPPGHVVDRDALRRVRDEARALRGSLSVGPVPPADAGSGAGSEGLLLALAYPDRIAQRRAGQAGRFLLRNGQGASVESATLAMCEYLVAADLDGRRRESRIFLAVPVALEEIESRFGGLLEREDVVEWDPATEAVLARRRERLGALVLRDSPLRLPDPDRVAGVLLETIAREGLQLLPWDAAATGVRRRIECLRRLDASWPDLSDAALTASLADWLGSHLGGIRKRDELSRLDLAGILLDTLSWSQRAALERLAPTHLKVPSGSSIPIDYSDPSAPVLAVRLQEVFGLTDTPRIAQGAIPLTMHLLSPARRPVQVTRDLAGFWKTTYFDVKKDLKGRYPKHYWPDDPLRAIPTRHARPRT